MSEQKQNMNNPETELHMELHMVRNGFEKFDLTGDEDYVQTDTDVKYTDIQMWKSYGLGDMYLCFDIDYVNRRIINVYDSEEKYDAHILFQLSGYNFSYKRFWEALDALVNNDGEDFNTNFNRLKRVFNKLAVAFKNKHKEKVNAKLDRLERDLDKYYSDLHSLENSKK